MVSRKNNVFEEMMKIVTVTKMLMDDVLQNWEGYSHCKQYAYGLLGKMLLEKIATTMEIYRGIDCDSPKSIESRLRTVNISLIKEQRSIIFLLDMTKWPIDFDEEWTETNSLELCQDVIVVACGCSQGILQQLCLESILKRKPN